MANTTNLDLVKPLGTDHALISQINGNMDKIDAFAGNTNSSLNSLADGLAILANGNTHAAITSGQFVYVRGHGTLADGLYQATSNIAQDGTLSGSNLTADSSGGLNTVYSSLNSKITHNYLSGDLLATPLDTSSTVKTFETVGKNVCITFRGQDRNHSENEVFMQIPSGYRPGGDRYFPIVISSTSGGYAVGIMKANGDVMVWSSNPPYGRIICMLSYMAD